jgi:hypothetical protein
VTIRLENGARHDATIIEFGEPEKIGDTDWATITFTYFDANTDNYISSCVNDILTSTVIYSNYEAGYRNQFKIKLSDMPVFAVYSTILLEEYITDDVIETGEMINGIHKNSRVITQTSVKLMFYFP